MLAYGGRLPAVNATLVNSLMVRALDFNDIYWKEDPSHPSDLIPAALAVGEMGPGGLNLAAGLIALEDQRRHVGAAQVDGGGETGRAGSDHDRFVDLLTHFFGLLWDTWNHLVGGL